MGRLDSMGKNLRATVPPPLKQAGSARARPIPSIGFLIRSCIALLHCDDCADRNFRKEFAGSIFRQANATMRCRIVRHVSGVHSKIQAAQPHEIRHLHVVDAGTMVSFLIRNYEVTSACGVTLASS